MKFYSHDRKIFDPTKFSQKYYYDINGVFLPTPSFNSSKHDFLNYLFTCIMRENMYSKKEIENEFDKLFQINKILVNELSKYKNRIRKFEKVMKNVKNYNAPILSGHQAYSQIPGVDKNTRNIIQSILNQY